MRLRFGMFATVGAVGFALQIGVLLALTAAGWGYVPATALAVELAVLHNFYWHERWTWRDRIGEGRVAVRLARFHATTGVTSIGGNLVITAMLVEAAGLHAVAANVAAVGLMSLANFLVADRWVFARSVALAVAIVATAPRDARAAELSGATVDAWNRYVTVAEGRLQRQTPAAGVTGEPVGDVIRVIGGSVHRWRGSTLVRGVTVDALVEALMHPGTPPPQEDLLESRVLGRSAEGLRVYLKLIRRTLITVTYDTEHDMTFRRHSSRLTTSRSVATRIAEVGGTDRGFLWRLNSYWRYEQVGRDVRVELESLSLSREVPALLRPVAAPIISRVGRESMTRTLDALKRHLENRSRNQGEGRRSS